MATSFHQKEKKEKSFRSDGLMLSSCDDVLIAWLLPGSYVERKENFLGNIQKRKNQYKHSFLSNTIMLSYGFYCKNITRFTH